MCPANMAIDMNAATNWSSFPLNFPNHSYGYNAVGTAQTPNQWLNCLGLGGLCRSPYVWSGLPESRVAVPVDMVALAEWDPLRCDDDGDGDLHPEMLFPIAVVGRHTQRANAIFCDLHVECAPPAIWATKTELSWQRWNYDHQWHPHGW